MPTTEEIVKEAEALGKLIAEHASVKKLESIAKRLDEDVDAQRAMTDLNRHIETLGEKQQAGKPIEVSDKKKLETLQKAVSTNRLLGEMQMAQMDYLDLMRKVDEALSGEAAPGATTSAGGDLGMAMPGV